MCGASDGREKPAVAPRLARGGAAVTGMFERRGGGAVALRLALSALQRRVPEDVAVVELPQDARMVGGGLRLMGLLCLATPTWGAGAVASPCGRGECPGVMLDELSPLQHHF